VDGWRRHLLDGRSKVPRQQRAADTWVDRAFLGEMLGRDVEGCLLYTSDAADE